MAIDNLSYNSSGLPAGQQTDKYSSQPGCLKSKNLDIFSSSKSVKATAFSTPVNTDESGIVLVDQTGNLILKSDGAVYDRSSGTEVLVKSGIATNFPSYPVSYNGRYGTYADATWGTERQLISKYENGTLKAFDLFTDRNRYSYSTEPYLVLMSENDDRPDGKMIGSSDKWTVQGTSGISWRKSDNSKTSVIKYKLKDIKGLTSVKLYFQASNSYYAEQGILTIDSINIESNKYYYNAELDAIEPVYDVHKTSLTITDQPDNATGEAIYYEIPLRPLPIDADDYGIEYSILIGLKVTAGTDETYTWTNGVLMIYTNEGYDGYYNYLPISENRYLKDVGEYYWEKGGSFQTLYDWSGVWVDHIPGWSRTVRYDLEKYMGWESNVSMDIVTMIAWNEQVYMIGNMNGNGYIIPCDLSGGMGTPYIAYGCTFKGAVNIDYLLYLAGDDRGVNQLWVYNGQELVAILGGNEEENTKNLIKTDEQYKFDGKMVEYRGNLVLATTDNRLFEYGQTYGGKGGSFIHQLPINAVITSLKANGDDLIVSYSITVNDTTTHYSITYQDDTPIKNYNTEWEAVYPIVVGNHLLEKEETDLYVSYILPSANTSLEFWGCANHYHFRTFTSSDSYTFSTTASYKMKGCTGNYVLKYIETNGNQYTFRLEGDLPIQTTNDMKITDTEGVELITYSDFNHFRKIGEITTTEYQEGEFRFHNLNNKLELPKSYSLQIMVKGKGTANYTPELFALDLVANQRDRG